MDYEVFYGKLSQWFKAKNKTYTFEIYLQSISKFRIGNISPAFGLSYIYA